MNWQVFSTRVFQLLIFSSVMFSACQNHQVEKENASCADSVKEAELASRISHDSIAAPTVPSGNFSLSTFKNEGAGNVSGYGYDILNDGKIMVHQPHIPAVNGMKGFSSKEEAEKAGSLMLTKIQNGIMPPTLSIEELDSMKIKY